MRFSFSKILHPHWSLYLVRGGVVAVNMVSMLLLGLLMRQETFGRFVFLWAIVLTVAAVVSLGAPQFLLREMSARQAGPECGVTFGCAVRLVLIYPALAVSVLVAGAWGLAAWTQWGIATRAAFNAPELALMAASAFLLNLTVHLAGPLRITGRLTAAMVLRDAGPQLALILAAILLAACGDLTAETALAGFVAVTAPALVLVLLWIRRHVLQQVLWRQQGPSTSYQYSFWWSTALGTVSAQVDILVGGLFMSPANLGVYQILKRFANLVSLPQIIANWVVVVGVGKAFAERDVSAIEALCRRGLRLALGPALALLAVSLAIAPLMFGLYNIEVTAVSSAAYLILLMGAIVGVAFGLNFTVASQCNLERYAALARAGGILISAGLIFAFGADITPILLAMIGTVSAISTQAWVWYAVKRRLGVDTSVISFWKVSKAKHDDGG